MRTRSTSMHGLVVGGDWACAHGDAGGLGDVVHRLAIQMPPSLRATLRGIEQMASERNGEPFAGWAAVRPSIMAYLEDEPGDDRGSTGPTTPRRARPRSST